MIIQFEVPDDSSKETQEAMEHMQTEHEVQKLNAVCFWLIKMLRGTNAESFIVTQENVTYLGENIGNYKITVAFLGAAREARIIQ